MNEDSRNDRRLVERCAAGEESAWREFFDRFAPWIRGTARSVLFFHGHRDPGGGADEVAQECLLALVAEEFRLLKRYRPEVPLKSYLRVLAVSRALNWLRDRTDPAVPVPKEGLESRGKELPDYDTREELDRAIERLPSRERMAVLWYYMEGLSYGQIAPLLGIPENSVGPLLSEARERLKKLLF